MANRKISEFTALTAPDGSDVLAIIDQSESGADKNKKITYANLLSKIPDGSVATPSVSFLSDQNSGISGGSDTLILSTGGAAAISVDSSQNVTLSANLTVNGTTTTINTTNLDVEDKNITLAKVSSPSDTIADGGGITIKGSTDKTFNWVNSTDAFTSSEHIHLGDNKKLLVGSGSDLVIYHNGTSSFIDNNNGSVYIRNNVDNWNADHIFIEAKSGDSSIKCLGEADVELYYDGSKKIYTQSNGARVEGRLWVNDYIDLQGNLFLQDNKKVVLGNGSDLEIYHDPQYGHSWIKESGGGGLSLATNSFELYNSVPNEKMITAYQDGAVEIYWDGSKKMESTSSGITVTGTVTETSDISLKNNINTIQNPLDLIEQIRGINFTWKTNGMKSMGVIAQDVEKVFPELVHGSEGSKSLQYSGLIGALVESVKELSAKVNALEAK